MSGQRSRDDGNAFWVVGILLVAAVLMLAVVVALRRQVYPDGTLLLQRREVLVRERNPELHEFLECVDPGTVTLKEVRARLGEPETILRGDDVDVWVYESSSTMRHDAAWLGLIPAGSSTNWAAMSIPVGVKDGKVVYFQGVGSVSEEVRQSIVDRMEAYEPKR